MSALARLSEPKLRAWIVARMRGEQEDPPVAEGRLESPDDYVRVLHDQSSDAKFRARIERAVVAALREAAAGALRSGRNARAVRYLAALADGLELREAASVLEEIADRGAFGGQDGELDPDAEELVLAALVGLQAPRALWAKWFGLWRREIRRLWPVVTAGLRLSDPKQALSILPKAVERGMRHADFPLGEVLWAFATDEKYKPRDVAKALEGLSKEARARCRAELKAMGAEPEEVDAWAPVPATREWWVKPDLNIRRPPRFMEAPACP